MQASARTCGRSAADSMIQNVASQRQSCASQKSTNRSIPSEASELSTPSSGFVLFFLPHPQESSRCSQPVRGKVSRTGRISPEDVERSFLDPEHNFVAVRRIIRTRFARQKFAQLRTNHIREILTACLLYTSPSPRDVHKSRMPSSA